MDMGIIGGADGPTAIIVTGSPWGLILPAVILGAAVGAAVYFLRRKRNK